MKHHEHAAGTSSCSCEHHHHGSDRRPAWSGALCVLAIGILACLLACTEGYEQIINAKFRWLTIVGGLLLILMGAASFRGGIRPRLIDILPVGVLSVIVILGQPFSSGSAKMSAMPKGLPEALSLGTPQFPYRDIRDLWTGLKGGTLHSGDPVTLVGVVKGLDEVNRPGEIAVARTYVVCCAADAYGMGFRIVDNRMQQHKDGTWVIVRGWITQKTSPDPVDWFRLGTASFSTVSPDYELRVSEVVPYEFLAYQPPIADWLSGKGGTRFQALLEDAGLITLLKEEGPYTLFVPVDQAIEQRDADRLRAAPLKAWLRAHIIEGRYTKKELYGADVLTTIDGRSLKVTAENGRRSIGDAKVLFSNEQCRNGAIHYIFPTVEELP